MYLLSLYFMMGEVIRSKKAANPCYNLNYVLIGFSPYLKVSLNLSKNIIKAISFVNKEVWPTKKSLLGLKDGEALGIISLDPKGRTPEVLQQLDGVQSP